ncbi:VOC family protein [Ferrimonas marina]|uniref:Lactoylglutathione lyase n=1 Tax=Ferrimonas marina TaxID=299255 RepID=A0A1M5RWS0_9GAMM|nr:VOC family protein [Ferrimonas marina]SHH30629.1 lactoylglutathione lyase [Ferrimonas marina]
MITRINHIGLRVRDLDTALAFYQGLGFEYIAGPLGPEPVAVVEHPSGININFILNADQPSGNLLMDVAEKHTGYTHVALEVTSGEALLARLTELGIPLSGGPMQHPTGTSYFVRDPDGNVVEFIDYQGLDALRQMASTRYQRNPS